MWSIRTVAEAESETRSNAVLVLQGLFFQMIMAESLYVGHGWGLRFIIQCAGLFVRSSETFRSNSCQTRSVSQQDHNLDSTAAWTVFFGGVFLSPNLYCRQSSLNDSSRFNELRPDRHFSASRLYVIFESDNSLCNNCINGSFSGRWCITLNLVQEP